MRTQTLNACVFPMTDKKGMGTRIQGSRASSPEKEITVAVEPEDIPQPHDLPPSEEQWCTPFASTVHLDVQQLFSEQPSVMAFT